MSFFESVPELPPPPFEGPEPPAWMRQDAMIPGWSPAGLLLIRTDDVAVAVGGVRGYPNGFEFTVHVRLRQQGFVWGTGPFDSLADPRTARAPEQALRLGILYANGRRARTPSYRPRPVIDKEADGGHLILLPIGGGGSERQWDGDFWVHPLPPNGPVTFVASWLLYEVAETHAELDSSAIYDAAQRADILWP